MHTLASKVSIQQQSRLASPRFYYKISENQSTCSKLVKYWRILITFLFTQVSQSVKFKVPEPTESPYNSYHVDLPFKVNSKGHWMLRNEMLKKHTFNCDITFSQVGVILLIAGYMLCGAAIFQIIESDSRVGLAARAIEAGNKQI